MKRRGVTNLKVLEEPFEMEQVGEKFLVHSWLQAVTARGGSEGP